MQIRILAEGLKMEFLALSDEKALCFKLFVNLVTLPIHPSTWLGDL